MVALLRGYLYEYTLGHALALNVSFGPQLSPLGSKVNFYVIVCECASSESASNDTAVGMKHPDHTQLRLGGEHRGQGLGS